MLISHDVYMCIMHLSMAEAVVIVMLLLAFKVDNSITLSRENDDFMAW